MSALLQAAINGDRRPEEHPALPVDPAAIARDARAVAEAGAGAIHLHVRDREGRESLHPDDVARCLDAARGAAPGTPIGVSTGAWIVPDPAERLDRVRHWRVLPDFASVNYHEKGAADLIRLLAGRGIGVEIGVWKTALADRVVREGAATQALRLLIEPTEENLDEAMANVLAIEATLARGGVAAPRLLHGFGPTVWGFVEIAARRGWATRIGLEDTLQLPGGAPAPGNAALVRAARQIIGAAAEPPD